jgi:hypothetical protein
VISLSQWFITLCLTVLNQYHLRRVISLSQWFITLSWLCLWLNCISITKESDKSITVISLSQWFITLCLWLYCISITKSDKSITVIYHTMRMSLTVLTTISVSLRRVISLSVSQWFITLVYICMSNCTVSVSPRLWVWYLYHSDLSHYHDYVSDWTVSVSLRRVISLSQWFITLCLWLYCISIT